MNKIKFISACVFVKDIRQAREFYEGLLGQKTVYDFGKNVTYKSGIALWEVQDGHEIQKELELGKGTQSGFELYFEMEDVEQVRRQIDKCGIRKLHDLKEESWGQRTIRIFDPDRHIIEIGEAMPVFIRRLLKTMSEEEVSAKTGISIDDIHGLLV